MPPPFVPQPGAPVFFPATQPGVLRFDDVRGLILAGLTSAQAETLGWNNEVRNKEVVASVVRTSDTVVTITLSPSLAYDITAQETITATIPGIALASGVSIVAAPTFTVDFTGPITVSPGVGSLVLTGLAPSLDRGINAGLGSLVLTGLAPSLNSGINAGVGGLVLTGFAPTIAVSNNQRVLADVGALTLTGLAPTVVLPKAVAAGLGALVLTGFAPTIAVSNNQRVLADTGQLILTGFVPTAATTGGTVSDPYAYFPGDTYGVRGKRYEEYSEEQPEQPKPKKKRRKKAEPTPLPPLPVAAPEPVTPLPIPEPAVAQSPSALAYVPPPQRVWAAQPVTLVQHIVAVAEPARIEPWILYEPRDHQEEADEEAIILAILRS